MRSIKFDQLGRKAELPPSVIAPTASLTARPPVEPDRVLAPSAPTARPGSDSDASLPAGSKSP